MQTSVSKENKGVMMKNKKYVMVCSGIAFAAVVLVCLFYRYINRQIIKEKLNIKSDSIVEVYDTLTEEGFFVKVIHKYMMDEQLFFVHRSGIIWSVEPVLESGWELQMWKTWFFISGMERCLWKLHIPQIKETEMFHYTE